MKGNHKELDVLVFGTNIPAGWHCSPYSNNSSDLAAVGPWGPGEAFHVWKQAVKKGALILKPDGLCFWQCLLGVPVLRLGELP